MSLGDATLYLNQGQDDQNGDCVALSPGGSFPVISTTGSLSGDLTYFDTSGNFQTLTPGSTSAPMPVTIPDSGCPSTVSAATATLTYGAHSITATIVAAPTAEAAPVISGTPVVGQTLTVTNSGNWSGAPTPTYSYQWLLCTSTCSPISGQTGSTLTLTSGDLGDQIKVQVTASNSLGTASGDSNAIGPVTTAAAPATTNPTPTTSEVKSALGGIGHPSGKKAITALLKGGVFKASFHAPSAGTVSIVWTTTVTTGTGKHRKHKAVTLATGTAHPGHSGTVQVTLHLTGTGKTLLKKKSSSLPSTAVEKFKPSGGNWTQVTKRFSL